MKLLIFIIINLFSYSSMSEEFIKPNADLSPKDVVEIQMLGLQSSLNNENIGIEQVWIFAHPDNKKATGPLERFKLLFKNPLYQPLIGNQQYNIDILNETKDKVDLLVSVTAIDDNIYEYIWTLKKFSSDSDVGVWMTSAVTRQRIKKKS